MEVFQHFYRYTYAKSIIISVCQHTNTHSLTHTHTLTHSHTHTHSHTQGSACIIGPTCAEAQKHASLLFWAVNEGLPLSNLPSGHSHPFLLFLSLSPIPPLSVTYFLSLPPSLPSSHSPCHLFVSYGIFHIFLFLSVAVSISLPPSIFFLSAHQPNIFFTDIQKMMP